MRQLRNLEPLICGPATSLIEVARRINDTIDLFQIVVDRDNRVIGTATDGDIRRAILNGAAIEAPISEAMHRSPQTGTQADVERSRAILSAGDFTFLPIVDDQGRLQEVWAETGQEKVLSRAVIMAGGFGRRLGEQTKNKQKVLLPVGDVPMLGRILDALEAANVHEIFISAHFMSDQIEAFVAERRNKSEVSVIHENQPLGTAGCLGQISHSESKSILVINGDVLTKLDLVAMIDFHTLHEYDASIAVAQHEVEIPFGVVRHDEDGKFLGIDEKPTLRNFVAAGIYYLSSQFCNLVGPGESIDMPDLLNRGRQIGLPVGLFPIHEYWRDIGRPSDLQQANNDYGADPSKDGV